MTSIRSRMLSAATFLTCLLMALPSGFGQFSFQNGDRVLFIGDSITQDGRYVDLVQGYLWARHPDLGLTIINAGLSSETVSGITEPVHPFPRPNILDRIERVLMLADPDIVFVCYGMNDGIYHPVEDRITDAYRNGLQQVLTAIDKAGAKAYLLSPPVFDVNAPGIQKSLKNASTDEPYGYRRPFEQYDSTLIALTNIMQSYQQDPRVLGYIDVHASTHDFLMNAKQANADFTYGDGVHPPLEGHAAMARAILIGLDEPEPVIISTMANVFGIRPPGTSAEELPSHASADQIRELLFKRGRTLSAIVRERVSPKSDGAGIADFAEGPAMRQATKDAEEIREKIIAAKRDF